MAQENLDLAAEIARLTAENEALKAKQHKAPGLTLKVGNKGGISVYGLSRFPITMYLGQMERFLGHSEQIKAFIEAHRSELSVKGQKE